MAALVLPYPKLVKGRFASIEAYTDEALYRETGLRIAFTCRSGGVSTGPYASLNLGTHVNDDRAAVEENRLRLLRSFASVDTPLVVPNQVHGDAVVTIEDSSQIEEAQQRATEGADALIVGASHVAALLCYADCVPVIVASPTGRFSVIHAGWRGVMNTISAKSVSMMAQQDRPHLGPHAAQVYNVYIGPHIRRECFETSEEIYRRFIDAFGASCDAGYRHIDLSCALRVQLEEEGIETNRICDLGICTVCRNDEFFSFRAQGGTAGRHGAFAVAN